MRSRLTRTASVSWLETVVRALEKASLEAILVGNAAAAVHGAPVTTQDLDFFVRPTGPVRRKIHRVAAALKGVVREPSELSDTLRVEGNFPDVDFLFHIGPFRFEAVRGESTRLLDKAGRVFLAPLEIVIRSKEHFHRDKDRAVLPILKKTLAVLRAMDDEAHPERRVRSSDRH